MPKGLKPTSSIITISGEIAGQTQGTFGSKSIDLSLNPLDNEVFVVVAVSLNPDMVNPNLAGAIEVCENELALTSTQFTSMPNESDTNCFAYSRLTVYQDGGIAQAVHETNGLDVPPASLDYLAIIATSDFYANTLQNHSPTVTYPTNTFRVWGYRAVADSATYAALTQSQLLSS